ncbi:MAG: hypothetical protein LBW77_05990 [Verrucomicrobiota bacterium]|jgi:hypothetical protein|nr:hypothetical protein [Verrucomicrobiota bacterium]
MIGATIVKAFISANAYAFAGHENRMNEDGNVFVEDCRIIQNRLAASRKMT